MTDLIPIESVNALELFTGNGLDSLLQKIKEETEGTPVDLETDAGRKEIASVAYKVARSKVVIDNAGKELVADWKRRSKEVDTARKKARDFLDALRDDIRRPLTEWEEEQARIEAEKIRRAELELLHTEALELDALWEREQEVKRKEAEIARLEAERAEKERKEREAAERKEREERIAREAEERAKREAEESLRREREARERAEQQAKEAEERSERERAEAEERAKRQAEEAAERERQKVKLEEERKRQEEAAKAADQANRNRVHRVILNALVSEGVDKETAIKVVKAVIAGKIPSMTIHY